jgi:N utilization substance protein A
MSKELLLYIDQIGREKGLDREVVIRAIEEAMSAAIKKRLNTTMEMATKIDRMTGEFSISAEKRVSAVVANKSEEISLADAVAIDPDAQIGGIVLVPQDMSYLGRIAAQIAKQVIIQKVREAERDMIHTGFKDREGDLITGRIHHRDKGDLIIDLGKVEALLPKQHQIPHESFRTGDHVRAYLAEVQKVSKGPQIILTRTAPEFLRKLFELEVPEIHDGTVEIVNVVREPGERAKIAVLSHQKDVDPVGACVGVKGSRVQAVVRELRGEKIDIIPFSDDLVTYVKNSLSPAVIEEIRINKTSKHILVIVPDQELSQAIGKKGQNVRLASRLVGWEIDIKSLVKIEDEERAQRESAFRQQLSDALGIPLAAADSLVAAGFLSVDDVAKSRSLDLEALDHIDHALAEQIIDRAKTHGG